MVDNNMLEFVKNFIESHDPIATKLNDRFPFRRLYDHCFRCYRWAQRINLEERGSLEVVEISALFHDIGKCVDNSVEGHAREGAKVCQNYLQSINFDSVKTKRIVSIVENHVEHCQGGENTLEARIESDADLLDELGAMTVLWDCMAIGAGDIQSYQAAYERIKEHYKKQREGPALLTETGNRFRKERLEFLRNFLCNLELELGKKGTLPFDQHLD